MKRLIIVGLGNIGKRYEKTPHNIGFNLIYTLSYKYNLTLKKNLEYNGMYGEKVITLNQKEFILGLLIPWTFMNNSGLAVKKVAPLLESLDDLLICTDNKDLSVGTNKLKNQGRSQHHNGIASIDKHLNTQIYPRLRIGTGKVKVINENMTDENIKKCLESAIIECIKWIHNKTG
ncbi:Peptidyl-tRNA hydrolase [seawater metagenome]|uniref:Peptidyl-tRNA hydrolase n=1 Tax=seawater metagenome TaxID=1561972 RepID=A0A5E8CK19_9ZZZZ